MKQISEFTVNSHEEDFNGIVSASSVLRYMQETANLEHYYYGPTTDELRKRNIAFVISRVAMKIYEPLEAFDKIKVEKKAEITAPRIFGDYVIIIDKNMPRRKNSCRIFCDMGDC